MGRRILYISYDGMTDPLGQSQVLPYLTGLSVAGYDISIISCEKPESAGTTAVIEAICKEHKIQWYPLAYTRKPPILSTIKDVRAIRRKAGELHAQAPFELVHCRSYISALAGLWMKRKFGVKFLFDMRGFWADERVDGGLWRLSNPLYKTVYNYFKKKEKAFLGAADAVVSLTHAAKKEMESWNLPRLAPVTVIPCCVDTELFDPAKINPAERRELRKTLDIPENAQVVGYVGSVGTWYLLNEMLSFFKVYHSSHPDAVLLFVTSEPAELILKEAAAVGLSLDVLRIRKGARKEMPLYISIMDLGLFFIKPAYSKKASSPVKQGELMAMGLKVVCNAGVGDSDHILNHYHSGILVPEFTEAAYSAAIDRLDKTPFDTAKIRSGAMDYFDLRNGVEAYKGIYQQLTQ